VVSFSLLIWFQNGTFAMIVTEENKKDSLEFRPLPNILAYF
jgi:hypothetical protein